MSEPTRRDVLKFAGACAACAMGGGLAANVAQAAGPKTVAIGKLADFPKAGFYDKFARPNRLLIARLDDRLVAMSATCTHKGALVKINGAEKEPALRCPQHGAKFSAYGTPTDGPAKTALPRYAISQAADGTITVDTTKEFIESKWEDAAAFVPLKKA